MRASSFTVPENAVLGIADKKVGDTFQAVINYRVVETAGVYVIVQVKHVHILQEKRT